MCESTFTSLFSFCFLPLVSLLVSFTRGRRLPPLLILLFPLSWALFSLVSSLLRQLTRAGKEKKSEKDKSTDGLIRHICFVCCYPLPVCVRLVISSSPSSLVNAFRACLLIREILVALEWKDFFPFFHSFVPCVDFRPGHWCTQANCVCVYVYVCVSFSFSLFGWDISKSPSTFTLIQVTGTIVFASFAHTSYVIVHGEWKGGHRTQNAENGERKWGQMERERKVLGAGDHGRWLK